MQSEIINNIYAESDRIIKELGVSSVEEALFLLKKENEIHRKQIIIAKEQLAKMYEGILRLEKLVK